MCVMCVGLIIVLVAFPTVPLDDELLAALSIGTPIGLGTYCAWVNRERQARVKTIGFCAERAPGVWAGAARMSNYRVSRSCVDFGRWGATTTVPSNTSG